MALVLDGNGDITGLTTGALEATAIGTGAIRQVVQYGEFSSGSLTSSSFVQLGGMTQSITPTSSSSRILVMVSLPGLLLAFSTNSAHCYSTIYRNGVNLSTAGSFGLSLVSGNSSAGQNWSNANIILLDSPSTTSPVTYAVYVRNIAGTAGAVTLGEGGTRSTLTLLEIA